MLNSFSQAIALTEEISRSGSTLTAEQLQNQAGVSLDVAKNMLATQSILGGSQQPIYVNTDNGIMTTIPPKQSQNSFVAGLTSVFDLVTKGIQTYSSVKEATAKPALMTTVKPTVETATLNVSSNPQNAIPNGSNTTIVIGGKDTAPSTQASQPIISGFNFDLMFLGAIAVIAIFIMMMNRK